MSRLASFAIALAILPFAIATAFAAASNDKRPAAGHDPAPRMHYCIKNAESGACEDCWSGNKVSGGLGGTCKELKEATNDPNVHKGKCSDVINKGFCKPKMKP